MLNPMDPLPTANRRADSPGVASFDQPRWLWPRAAYVHVPFCAHHCCYCDFAVVAGRDSSIDIYLDALEAELRAAGPPHPVETLFLGGGTPTHLTPKQLDRLLTLLDAWLPLVPAGEYSIEANPGSLTMEKLHVLAQHGVTRVSLGSQSFQPRLLRVLERDHQSQDIVRAVNGCRQIGAQVSLDLIFGVPGQTFADWHADLRQALALSPDHVSTYGLTYEKGTRLWKQRERGELLPLAEDAELQLYAAAIDVLESAGFEHYEISNFARPGRRCRHNEVYWANEAYWGSGMGAARYVFGRRELNTRDLQKYVDLCLGGKSPTWQSEQLEPRERAQETLAIQLRRGTGIHRDAFHQQTGFTLDELAGAELAKGVALGLLADTGERVFLTRRGKYVADSIIERLL